MRLSILLFTVLFAGCSGLSITETIETTEVTETIETSETNHTESEVDHLQKGQQLLDSIRWLEDYATNVLDKLNNETSARMYKHAEINWAYATNITDENNKRKVEASLEFSEWAKQTRKDLLKEEKLWKLLPDPKQRRLFKMALVPSVLDLPADELKKYYEVISDMGKIYSTAKVCDDAQCDLALDPDLSEIFRTSRDASQLKKMWLAWRAASGKKMRENYKEYIRLANKGAQGHGYADYGEMWRVPYEVQTLTQDAAKLAEGMQPLYKQLHAYVRRKLREVYGPNEVSERGPIPAHLLGNMWSQSWGNIYDLVKPFEDNSTLDVTDAMVKQNYTTRKMFEMADEFFLSLGTKGVSEKFYEKSLIEKPDDREVECHASAWDFGTGDDFRIKQCTKITMEDFITVHHEMGHIQYYIQYKDQHAYFREGANPGFHEAVGDVVALSISTPKHLHTIGLLDTPTRTHESDINYLMSIALNKIPFSLFAYTLESWRWEVFNDTNLVDKMNCHWWDKRFKYQGIKPPATRTEEDFDPGAKNHVPTNIPYVRYLVANILQFQFHKALCLIAGEYDPTDPQKPLHMCDIYKSKEAGNAFNEMLSLGSSQPWPSTLEGITGCGKMSSSAILEYFKPLEEWLRKDNEEHGEYIGWEKDGEYCEPIHTGPPSEK